MAISDDMIREALQLARLPEAELLAAVQDAEELRDEED